MKPKLSIHLNDGLADAYAFATLYENLKENGFEADVRVVYVNDVQLKKFKELIKSHEDLDFLRRERYLLDFE
ncbi:MAG: hypothetical protein AABX39_05910 [Nanoarchaeota archaeon]